MRKPVPPHTAEIQGLSQRAGWAGGEPLANLLMAKALVNPGVVSLAVGFVDQQTHIPGDYCYSRPERAPKNRLRSVSDFPRARISAAGWKP